MIADAFLQQILLRPAEYSVIATLNLNGDYVSDALAAQVGGIGIAPGANMSDSVAMFEATHGTAPKYAGKDYVNPGSEILSAEMMLRHMGWTEAADLIISSMEKSILSKKVTYDFARLMDGATQVSLLGLRPGDDRPHVVRWCNGAARTPTPAKPRISGAFSFDIRCIVPLSWKSGTDGSSSLTRRARPACHVAGVPRSRGCRPKRDDAGNDGRRPLYPGATAFRST